MGVSRGKVKWRAIARRYFRREGIVETVTGDGPFAVGEINGLGFAKSDGGTVTYWDVSLFKSIAAARKALGNGRSPAGWRRELVALA